MGLYLNLETNSVDQSHSLHAIPLSVGNDRVDIFYRVANPSIWMCYLLDPSTNRVLFV